MVNGMTTGQPKNSSRTISSFVMTHCRTCAAGWTRASEAGNVVTVCLLDREPVWHNMASCDRYKKREPESPKPSSMGDVR